MSLSWRERLLPSWWRPTVVVHIQPQHIAWSRQSGGIKPRILDQGVVHAEQHGKDVQPLLAALPQALREAGATGARVELVLSNVFMRYAIVPNPDGAANGEELALLCRHAFQRVDGDIVAEWNIQLSLAALGGNGLASAMDQNWLDALKQLVKTEKGQLISVQPLLAHAFNRLAKAEHESIFVLREPERLCLLAWQNRSWSAVQMQTVLADWQAVLEVGLRRLHLQLELPESTPGQLCELVQGDMQPRMAAWRANWSLVEGVA